MILMVRSRSDTIEAVGYDAAHRELHVRFTRAGSTYVYANVERVVYEEFLRRSRRVPSSTAESGTSTPDARHQPASIPSSTHPNRGFFARDRHSPPCPILNPLHMFAA